MGLQNLSGQVLGQYELRELLGVGGMGAVYRARQITLDREVAVKVLSSQLASESGYIERFYREARTAAALEHKFIVPIHDYGVQGDLSFVAMRLLSGGTIHARMQQRKDTRQPLPSLGETVDMLKQVASALDYAHNEGVIHRDVKPSNVMFDNQGDAYLVDFGIAKILESTHSMTATGMAMGTPSYMPPEQWRAEDLTPAADQYALAVMVYSLIVGRVPFEAPTPYGLMHKHLNDTPTPPQSFRADVPNDVTLVLERALAKRAEDRFPSVTAFAQAFERAVGSQRGESMGYWTFRLPRTTKFAGPTPSPSPVPAPRPIYRHPLMWLSAAVIVLLAGALLAQIVGTSGGDAKTLPSPQVVDPIIKVLSPTPILAVTPKPTITTPAILSEGDLRATDQAGTSAVGYATQAHIQGTRVALGVAESQQLAATSTANARHNQALEATNAAMAQVMTVAFEAELTRMAVPSLPPSATDTPSNTPDINATIDAALVERLTAIAAQWTDTPSPTATWTYTPTDTPSSTATYTHTPTERPSPTATWTYTPTDRPSPTATWTHTPTMVPTLSPITDMAIGTGVAKRRVLVLATDYRVLGFLEQGEQVPILSVREDGVYYQILFEGEIGWVYADALAFVDDSAALPVPYSETAIGTGVAKRRLLVLATDYRVLGYLEQGKQVLILGTSREGIYYVIQFEGQTGLVYADALTIEGVSVASPIPDSETAIGTGVTKRRLLVLATDYRMLGYLEQGEQVPIFGTSREGVYYVIRFEGQTGLVYAEALTIEGVSAAEPTPDAVQLAYTPVTRNTDWTPVIQEFDGIPMVLVPAGCFEMGSNNGYNDEQPVHEVCFEEPFWIGQTEVTNAQYKRCVEAGGCTAPGDITYYNNAQYSNHPVAYVDWNQASAYAAWWGDTTGTEVRLPTEAQWEYAARGPDGLTYPWGNSSPTCSLANTSGCVDNTSPVGSTPAGASWVNALDMCGNISEWGADWLVDPSGPVSGDYRVLRGGSWSDSQDDARAAVRYYYFPNDWSSFVGFRVMRPPFQ